MAKHSPAHSQHGGIPIGVLQVFSGCGGYREPSRHIPLVKRNLQQDLVSRCAGSLDGMLRCGVTEVDMEDLSPRGYGIKQRI